MLHQWIRCFHSDNGTLTDYSIEAQNADSIPFAIVADEDYLYIGQNFPFNNFYFQVGVANTNASVLSVQYWDKKQWRDAVDVLDGTKTAGKTLAKNGVVQFSPDKDYSWQDTKSTKDNGEPTELSTLTLYDLYWIRVKFSANLSATTTLKKISYAFTTSEFLSGLDPEINEYLKAFGGISKTNWDDQILIASQHIVADLKSRQLVYSNGQILRFDDVSLACAYRTLSYIYSQLGEPFKSKKEESFAQYSALMNIKRFTLDENHDGLVSLKEIGLTTGRLVR